MRSFLVKPHFADATTLDRIWFIRIYQLVRVLWEEGLVPPDDAAGSSTACLAQLSSQVGPKCHGLPSSFRSKEFGKHFIQSAFNGRSDH